MLIFILLLFSAASASCGQDTWTGVDRVVAVGDVHGDLNGLVEVLRSAGLIDNRNRWTGGKTHLVQTGDLLDRGPDSRKVMDLLMSIEDQAAKAGGAVHVLTGNHEAMNLYGDLRYVSPADFASYRTSDSERLRDRFWEQHLTEMRSTPGKDDRRKWEADHPLGWFEQRLAFTGNGRYGKWLRSHPTIIRINDSIFVHGGISPRFESKTMAALNDQVASELNDLSRINDQSAVLAPDGPLWYRGLAQEPEMSLTDHVYKLLKDKEASRIVIGHTPTPGAVITRFAGKVVMIDAGISDFFGNRRACLTIDDGKLYAIHRGERVALPGDGPMDYIRYLRAVIALEPSPGLLNSYLKNFQRATGQD